MLIKIVVLAPFLGGILLAFAHLLRKPLRLNEGFLAVLGVSAPIVSLCAMASLFWEKYSSNYSIESISLLSWASFGEFSLKFAFYLDKLSILMGIFVAFLAALIHLYSIGYMKGDNGFGKFFSYMNLFLGSMFILVFGDSPIFMFFGWEGVGVCSYLLISFYFTDSENVKAGNKAFIVNRVGDLGFVLGLVGLYAIVGSFGFDYESLRENTMGLNPGVALFIGFCFICGALSKSAQIPLYTWLPDAMAGPTPISALIHAATMVTAGVYMVLRFDFLYPQIPFSLEVLGYFGAISALFAAIIATKANDIKKILAYSTMSQLGYMFAALSFAPRSSLFHLFTHGFFKALLFLGAGSIIIALHHEQNIFKMGGLKSNKILFYPMLIGSLALCGIFPFSGFFSKDSIILGAFLAKNYVICAILLFTAGLTAYYVFRMFFLVFFTKNHAHTHSVPKIMSFVNIILCFFAAFGGAVMLFLDLEHLELKAEIIGGAISVGVALLGILIAYKKFANFGAVLIESKNLIESGDSKYSKEEKMGAFERLVAGRFYIDELYDFVFVKSANQISKFFRNGIDFIISGAVLGVGLICRGSSAIFAAFSQNGRANVYALFMIFWVCLIALYIKVGL